jgi:hypothetical protein
MKATLLVSLLFVLVLPSLAQENKKTSHVLLTADCNDSVGSNAASAVREKLRGSNGYALESGPPKGKFGVYEIILTCAPIPGQEAIGSAVSYIFDLLMPDNSRYYLVPGIGIVGADKVDGWARSLFSQFDNWVASTEAAIPRG